MDVAVRVRHRIIRRGKVAGELVCRIGKAIARIEEPLRGLILNARFDPLAARTGNILKEAPALDDAGDVYDIVGGIRSEQCGFPFELPTVQWQTLPQPCLMRRGDHLL